jgi:recombinational DNA repair protein (RecF pathway)
MSYAIYSATGIVIGRLNVGESNVLLRICTLEYGIVSVSVQGALASSKLSPACNLLTHCVYDIIRGRHSWRLIGVSSLQNIDFQSISLASLAFLRSIASYTLRYVGSDEDPDIDIYTLVSKAIQKAQRETPTPEWFDSYRYQLLTLLGYIDDSEKPNNHTERRLLITQAEQSANIELQ